MSSDAARPAMPSAAARLFMPSAAVFVTPSDADLLVTISAAPPVMPSTASVIPSAVDLLVTISAAAPARPSTAAGVMPSAVDFFPTSSIFALLVVIPCAARNLLLPRNTLALPRTWVPRLRRDAIATNRGPRQLRWWGGQAGSRATAGQLPPKSWPPPTDPSSRPEARSAAVERPLYSLPPKSSRHLNACHLERSPKSEVEAGVSGEPGAQGPNLGTLVVTPIRPGAPGPEPGTWVVASIGHAEAA